MPIHRQPFSFMLLKVGTTRTYSMPVIPWQDLLIEIRGNCTSEGLTCRHEFFLLDGIDLRVTESEVFHHFHNSRGDDEPGEPLVIGRHHVPRRMLARGSLDRLLECMHVVVPVFTLFDIGGNFQDFSGVSRRSMKRFFCS